MKVRFTLFLTLLLTLFVSTPAKSQPEPKPDFTGTWLLDQKKSNDSGLPPRPDLPIKISHQDPEFRLLRPSESNGQIVELSFVYFTDSRGETNQATSGLTTNPSAAEAEKMKNQLAESKTKWSGNKIVRRMPLRLNAGGHLVELEQIDEWKLSDDGKVLTHTIRLKMLNSNGAFVPAMVPDKKRVYNRV